MAIIGLQSGQETASHPDLQKSGTCAGFYSIGAQAVVDRWGRFISFWAGFQGCVHDARAWRESGEHDRFQAWLNTLPTFTLGGVKVPPALLGDAAYPAAPTLLKGWQMSACDDRRKRRLNLRHCRGRMVVEGAFGMLKSKFMILKERVLVRDMQFFLLVVYCCVVLHNMNIEDARRVEPAEVSEKYLAWVARMSRYRGPAQDVNPTHHRIRDALADWLAERAALHPHLVERRLDQWEAALNAGNPMAAVGAAAHVGGQLGVDGVDHLPLVDGEDPLYAALDHENGPHAADAAAHQHAQGGAPAGEVDPGAAAVYEPGAGGEADEALFIPQHNDFQY